MTKEINLTEIEKQSVEYFLESGDFNGIPVSAFYSSEKMDFEKLRAVLLKGIETDRFRIISSDHELNPHIIREGFRDIDAQIKSIRPDNVHHICIYPSKSVLKDYLTDDQFRPKLSDK